MKATVKQTCVLCGSCHRKPKIHSAFHLEYKEDICETNRENLEIFSVTGQISLQKKHKTKVF